MKPQPNSVPLLSHIPRLAWYSLSPWYILSPWYRLSPRLNHDNEAMFYMYPVLIVDPISLFPAENIHICARRDLRTYMYTLLHTVPHYGTADDQKLLLCMDLFSAFSSSSFFLSSCFLPTHHSNCPPSFLCNGEKWFPCFFPPNVLQQWCAPGTGRVDTDS